MYARLSAVGRQAVAGGVDGLALTHLDTAERRPDLRLCLDYKHGPALRPGPPGDVARQERLAAALGKAHPSDTSLTPGGPDGWVGAVADALRVPVVLRSHGPTA
jgi:adenylosuccinate synthase